MLLKNEDKTVELSFVFVSQAVVADPGPCREISPKLLWDNNFRFVEKKREGTHLPFRGEEDGKRILRCWRRFFFSKNLKTVHRTAHFLQQKPVIFQVCVVVFPTEHFSFHFLSTDVFVYWHNTHSFQSAVSLNRVSFGGVWMCEVNFGFQKSIWLRQI